MALEDDSTILLPIARYIGGNIGESRGVVNDDGTPKLDADGNKVTEFNFAIGIPKTTADWKQTDWGAKIYAVGKAGHPLYADGPTFAWKIIDGDSQIPNSVGKRPCDNIGHPGHWVMWLSSRWAIRTVSADGSEEILDKSVIKHGYYLEGVISVAPNKKSANGKLKPGVYLNPLVFALAGFGQVLNIGTQIDATKVGLGRAALPPGASAQPVSSLNVPAPKQMTSLALDTYEAYRDAGYTDKMLIDNGLMVPPAPAASAIAPPPVAQAIAPLPLMPPVFIPPVGIVSSQNAPPPKQMTSLARGDYETYRALGYSDKMLIDSGLMVAPEPVAPVAIAPPPVAIAPPPVAIAPPALVPPALMPTVGAVIPPPAAALKQMTSLAQGTYEAYCNLGYTDEMLIANGLMVPPNVAFTQIPGVQQ
jgi:hypothetical protein